MASSQASDILAHDSQPLSEIKDLNGNEWQNDWDTQATDKSGSLQPFITIPETQLCLLYTSPSPRDKRQSRMPSSA